MTGRVARISDFLSHGAVRAAAEAAGESPRRAKLRWLLHSGTHRLSAPVAPTQKLPPAPRCAQQTAKESQGPGRQPPRAARPTARLPPTPQQQQAAIQELEE